MKEQDGPLPRLYKYQKASDFLKDFHEAKKAQSKTWSYEAWARKLGQTKSTLVRTLNGTLSMSEGLEKALCQFFKFDPDEKSYFQLLVIQEKVKRLYPEIHIQLPKMDHARVANHKVRDVGGLPAENAAFMSAPEVGWLAVFLSGKGLTRTELKNIRGHFHEAFSEVEFETLIDECLRRHILKMEEDRVVFRSLEDVYLDGSMSEIEVSVQRYVKVLDLFKKMLLTDHEKGKIPVLNNRSSVLLMKSERLMELMDFINETSVLKALALFEDPKGDLVVDIQAFIAPLASHGVELTVEALAPAGRI